jgi:hypothetical protein
LRWEDVALRGVVPDEEEDDEQEAREVEEGRLEREAVLAWGALCCWGVGCGGCEVRPLCIFNRRVVGHHQLTMVLELVNVFGVDIGFAALN